MLQHGPILADVSAFMKSRVILTAGELDLFTSLDGRAGTARELAEEKGYDLRALTRLLDALAASDLLEKRGNNYHLSEKGSLLSSRHPHTILPMVLHMNHLWDGWDRLTEITRKGGKARKRKKPARDEGGRKAFIGAMHAIGRDLSGEIAEAYDTTPFQRLLDIGGASGTYTIAFLKKNPKLTALVHDLPAVVPMAEERLKAEGLDHRARCVSGDFYRDELPGGCDLALLSAIIHQNSPSQNINLYRKIYRALKPGGTILIRDHIMDDSRTRPAPGTLFALNMLVGTSGGNTYTFEEVKGTLETVGFEKIRLLRTGERMDCLVDGGKSAR